MRLDRSRIPLPIQEANAALLDRMEAEAIAQLRNPRYRWAFCVHEAGHGIYRLRVGATKLVFIPPHFVYDAAKSAVQTAAAGIGSDFTTFVSFRLMACYCVAGYLWQAKVMNLAEQETEGTAEFDKRVFKEDVRKFYPLNEPPVTEEQIEATWQWAIGEVRKDLDDPQIREDVLKLAREF